MDFNIQELKPEGVYPFDSAFECFKQTGDIKYYMSDGVYAHPCGKTYDENKKVGQFDCTCKKCSAIKELIVKHINDPEFSHMAGYPTVKIWKEGLKK